jgi:hypothetical protein
MQTGQLVIIFKTSSIFNTKGKTIRTSAPNQRKKKSRADKHNNGTQPANITNLIGDIPLWHLPPVQLYSCTVTV